MQLTKYAAILLPLVTSSLAYFVQVPNDRQGWKATGLHQLTWERVVTDASSFAVMLTNQDRSVLREDILLANYVDGRRLSIQLNTVGGAFPPGPHYRVNLIKNAREPHTIFAQSSEFTITN